MMDRNQKDAPPVRQTQPGSVPLADSIAFSQALKDFDAARNHGQRADLACVPVLAMMEHLSPKTANLHLQVPVVRWSNRPKLAIEDKTMNFLPKLSTGVQRSNGTGQASHSRLVTVTQVSGPNSIQLADDQETELTQLIRGEFAASDLGIPIYGNYCGPGHGDATGCQPAKDQVDATCCRHDVCYDQRGYFDCKCDCDLVRRMSSAIASTSSDSGKAAGAAAMALFATSPCFDHREICIPFLGCTMVPIPYLGGAGKCSLF